MITCAQAMGARLLGGECFVLRGDVGAGKTTFTRGLAAGLGVTAAIVSPTFTLTRSYNCRDGLMLHHFDFYRLSDAGVVAHSLHDALADTKNVIAVEWSDIVSDVLPADAIVISFTVSGEQTRQLKLSAPAQRSHIIEAAS